MRLTQTLICFFFLSLRDGSTALFEKDLGVRTGTEGEKITVGCTFTFSGRRKIFCRDRCEDGDILVETSGVSNRSGRFSIEYKDRSFTTSPMIYVSITNLKKSDSGRYRCKLARDWSPDGSETFELEVKDGFTAPTTTTPNRTLRPSSTSTSTKRTTLTLSSTSGKPMTTSFPQINNGSEQQPVTSDSLLYLLLLLVLLVIILCVILLIYCMKRARKPKAEATGPPVKTQYDEIAEANRVYEEIREDRSNKSPPRDISTVYTCAKFSKPHEVQATGVYSLAGPQTEDDSSKLTYSTVDFSNSPAASHNSAPSGGVIYSVPRVDRSSEDTASPLYSTVTLH